MHLKCLVKGHHSVNGMFTIYSDCGCMTELTIGEFIVRVEPFSA